MEYDPTAKDDSVDGSDREASIRFLFSKVRGQCVLVAAYDGLRCGRGGSFANMIAYK